jgi:hypothetical protein
VSDNAGENTLSKKGKPILVLAWKGPEGYRRLRLPDLKAFGT